MTLQFKCFYLQILWLNLNYNNIAIYYSTIPHLAILQVTREGHQRLSTRPLGINGHGTPLLLLLFCSPKQPQAVTSVPELNWYEKCCRIKFRSFIWRNSSLNELTLIIFCMELTHLGSEASIFHRGIWIFKLFNLYYFI